MRAGHRGIFDDRHLGVGLAEHLVGQAPGLQQLGHVDACPAASGASAGAWPARARASGAAWRPAPSPAVGVAAGGEQRCRRRHRKQRSKDVSARKGTNHANHLERVGSCNAEAPESESWRELRHVRPQTNRPKSARRSRKREIKDQRFADSPVRRASSLAKPLDSDAAQPLVLDAADHRRQARPLRRRTAARGRGFGGGSAWRTGFCTIRMRPMASKPRKALTRPMISPVSCCRCERGTALAGDHQRRRLERIVLVHAAAATRSFRAAGERRKPRAGDLVPGLDEPDRHAGALAQHRIENLARRDR